MFKALKEYTVNWRNIKFLNRKFKCAISYKIDLKIESLNQLQIGEHTVIASGTVIASQGYAKPENTKLIVGSNTYIGENNNIRVTDAEIVIGDNCLISQMVSLICANHTIPTANELIKNGGINYDKIGITIGNDVWIGCNTVVLPGVKIGNGAVIGAGSIVNVDVPAYSIAVGNPIKIIKNRK